jgi:transcriptional regulator with XRE-family HTH domain
MGDDVPCVDAARFGRRVAARRTELGISAKEFAEKVHIHPTTISRIEHGKIRRPSWDTVKRIADALAVDPSDLDNEGRT